MEHTRELTKIELHPENTNREGFSLSRTWKPLIQALKERRALLSTDK
jgi:hypothetical protein